MNEIKVLVTLQVDPDGEKQFSQEQMNDAVVEAINNALNFMADAGFEHALASDVSIGVAGVELVS